MPSTKWSVPRTPNHSLHKTLRNTQFLLPLHPSIALLTPPWSWTLHGPTRLSVVLLAPPYSSSPLYSPCPSIVLTPLWSVLLTHPSMVLLTFHGPHPSMVLHTPLWPSSPLHGPLHSSMDGSFHPSMVLTPPWSSPLYGPLHPSMVLTPPWSSSSLHASTSTFIRQYMLLVFENHLPTTAFTRPIFKGLLVWRDRGSRRKDWGWREREERWSRSYWRSSRS